MSDVRHRSRIRDRRQITLPRDICEELGLEIGDSVDLVVQGASVLLTPSRRRTLGALEAIRRAFSESDVTEEELLAAAGDIRERRFQERSARTAKNS